LVYGNIIQNILIVEKYFNIKNGFWLKFFIITKPDPSKLRPKNSVFGAFETKFYVALEPGLLIEFHCIALPR